MKSEAFPWPLGFSGNGSHWPHPHSVFSTEGEGVGGAAVVPAQHLLSINQKLHCCSELVLSPALRETMRQVSYEKESATVCHFIDKVAVTKLRASSDIVPQILLPTPGSSGKPHLISIASTVLFKNQCTFVQSKRSFQDVIP